MIILQIMFLKMLISDVTEINFLIKHTTTYFCRDLDISMYIVENADYVTFGRKLSINKHFFFF